MRTVPEERGPGGQYGHGWLAAVIPAEARRFRVADPELAAGLMSAGAILVDRSADVEIGPVDDLRDAALAVVDLGGPQREGSLPLRVASRVASSARVRVGAERARRVLRARGYPFVDVIPWDVSHTFRRPGSDAAEGSGRLAERLPLRASSSPGVTRLRRRCSTRRSPRRAPPLGGSLFLGGPSIRAGILVTSVDGAFLRVAVGPAASQIAAQLAVLDGLRERDVPALVESRVARQLARGKHGFAEWSLEQRLPGAPAPGELSHALLAECIDFLVALHPCTGGGRQASLAADAELVAAVGILLARSRSMPWRAASRASSMAFHAASDTVTSSRATCSSSTARSPASSTGTRAGRAACRCSISCTCVHRRTEAVRRGRGPGVVGHLVPWARAGGDAVLRDYCDRLGLSVDARTLEAIVLRLLARPARLPAADAPAPTPTAPLARSQRPSRARCGRVEARRRLLVLAVVASLVALAVLAAAVPADRGFGWDGWVADFITDAVPISEADVHADPFVVAPTIGVSGLAALLAVVLLVRRRLRAAFFVAAGITGAVLLSSMVKAAVDRLPSTAAAAPPSRAVPRPGRWLLPPRSCSSLGRAASVTPWRSPADTRHPPRRRDRLGGMALPLGRACRLVPRGRVVGALSSCCCARAWTCRAARSTPAPPPMPVPGTSRRRHRTGSATHRKTIATPFRAVRHTAAMSVSVRGRPRGTSSARASPAASGAIAWPLGNESSSLGGIARRPTASVSSPSSAITPTRVRARRRPTLAGGVE